jgi:hypothetical protein
MANNLAKGIFLKTIGEAPPLLRQNDFHVNRKFPREHPEGFDVEGLHLLVRDIRLAEYSRFVGFRLHHAATDTLRGTGD